MVQGESTIDSQLLTIRPDPFAASWTWTEARAAEVKLTANPHYWDTRRGPRVAEALFRNAVPPAQALDAVCTTEGEFDIVTEVPPSDAAKVQASKFARLVSIDAVRSVAGVINRHAEGLPLGDVRARRALNHAIDRKKLVAGAFAGHADPLAGLTPPCAVPRGSRLSPYSHSPRAASELWRAAGGDGCRPIRLAATANYRAVAEQVAADLRESLNLGVEVRVLDAGGELAARRSLAERGRLDFDVLIFMQGCQALETPALELHRAFVGDSGEYRAGPVVPAFEALLADLTAHTTVAGQMKVALALDKLVRDEALALFLAAPYALYAVNREVSFTPYRTTFELAECEVSRRHWSRR